MNQNRILLADNDPDYRKSLRALLALEGYQVVQASSVKEALHKVEADPLDLVLVDLRLADNCDEYDVSGFEVAKKAGEEGVPCIVLTAYPSVEATRQALRDRGIEPPLAVDLVPKTQGPQAVLDALMLVPSLSHLAVLHISDLHFRPPAADVPYNQARALRALKEDLRELKSQHAFARIKAVVVSGDVTFRGQRQGFEAAWSFFQELCAALKVSPGDVVLVPGNHDVDRTRARASWDNLAGSQQEADGLFAKLDDYMGFTTRFYGEAAFTPDRTYRVFDLGRLAIIAFNSCHREGNPFYQCRICTDEHYHGWIDPESVERAIAELDARLAGRKCLRLAVCHHHALPKRSAKGCPGDHLWNYDEFLKFRLAEAGISILLHGHAHKAQLLQPAVIGTAMPYPCGSGTLLFPESSQRWENQYLIWDFAPDRSRVIMRKYEPARRNVVGGWVADGSIQRDGVVELGVSLPA